MTGQWTEEGGKLRPEKMKYNGGGGKGKKYDSDANLLAAWLTNTGSRMQIRGSPPEILISPPVSPAGLVCQALGPEPDEPW